MKIYIPHTKLGAIAPKSLFILTRPFFNGGKWVNDLEVKKFWGLDSSYELTDSIIESDVVFIPKPINTYSKQELLDLNFLCETSEKQGYGYISGDFGKDYGVFDHLIFYRMGGFRRQLSSRYRGFPVMLSDHFYGLYQTKDIFIRSKKNIPVIGFCGHAHLGVGKRIKESLVFIKENIKRFFKKPNRKDFEPIFPSAYIRAKLLNRFEKSHQVETNFIYRPKYRAGAKTPMEKDATTKEYYENLKNSDYVICVRGAGNFSVRLYETLMMGRIPILFNTDCLLPFDGFIDWRKHAVFIDWNERKTMVQQVLEYHHRLTVEEFSAIQIGNRNLWKNSLSVSGIYGMISEELASEGDEADALKLRSIVKGNN